MSDNFRL